MDEGDPAPFVVKLSAQSVLPVRVPVATMDGTAVAGSDYTAIDRTLTFQPGTDSLTVDVSTRDGTDFVFDGTASEPYGEDDAPNPQSVYAASKLLGEWFAQGARHYVLRVESLFGGGEAPAPGAAGRRPFPRPQFFGGPRPQFSAFPRPQFSFEGCYLPLEPPLGQQRSTARSRRFERHATTRRSPERYDHRRYPHDVKRPGAEKPNVPTGVPPRTDQTPRNDVLAGVGRRRALRGRAAGQRSDVTSARARTSRRSRTATS